VLGSINLSKTLKEVRNQKSEVRREEKNKPFSIFEIDWELLGYLVHLSVRFLDNAIDANKYPVQEIEIMNKGNRKIGLGVMGWADMLIKLGIRYDSPEAVKLAEELMAFIMEKARDASAELARARGAFPNFKGSIYDTPEISSRGGLRNATTTTIAPTVSLSLFAGCSSGIVPLFAIAYKRLVLETELNEIHPYFLELAKKGKFYSTELIRKISKRGRLWGLKELPGDIKRLFVTAHEISPEDHINVQAAFQKFTDHAVSKTINLKHRAKREDIARAFLLAYEKGCKGITVFRYGSKIGSMVTNDDVD
jgi:ribonucleoside-diphosphate reductase alpha chain